MSQDLPTTSYAILGLLALGDDHNSKGLSGYEVKQRADRTLRFYWVSPAMSQVYTELSRLADLGLARTTTDQTASRRRTTRRYSLTAKGRRALRTWLAATEVEFPTLKHPVALRLLLGHLSDPESLEAMLAEYAEALHARRKELQGVRDSLRGADAPGQDMHYPSLVADWGLDYYDAEAETVQRLRRRLHEG